MRYLLSVALIFSSLFFSLAFAAVRLDLTLKLEDKVSKITMLSRLNEAAVVTEIDEKTLEGFELLARPEWNGMLSPEGKKALKISFELSKIANNKKTLIASPEFLGYPGQKMEISTHVEGEKEIRLSLVPTFQ